MTIPIESVRLVSVSFLDSAVIFLRCKISSFFSFLQINPGLFIVLRGEFNIEENSLGTSGRTVGVLVVEAGILVRLCVSVVSQLMEYLRPYLLAVLDEEPLVVALVVQLIVIPDGLGLTFKGGTVHLLIVDDGRRAVLPGVLPQLSRRTVLKAFLTGDGDNA